ncbi:MAG: endonuclease Q family protein [Firmicutes bacterium]|nr:endonuclease Q family protein [Bacillota bacterium]
MMEPWSYFNADLHIHIGNARGHAVKITASRNLQLRSILYQDAPRKGLDVVGIVDAGSTLVSAELEEMLAVGDLVELQAGGFMARNQVLLVAACEVESREGVHLICYLPGLQSLKDWQKYFQNRVHNRQLSTQRVAAGIQDVIRLSMDLGGIFCPAHAFTPHKGIYGVWTERLTDKIGADVDHIKVLELGLSADSEMADRLIETGRFTYLSNSDAHSAPNIGREFNRLQMKANNFDELRLCLENRCGRRVMANYGLDPRLGKYHRSFCPLCGQICAEEAPVTTCPLCGTARIIMGVYDRIVVIQDYPSARSPEGRPPYYYRLPLKDLPGIGPRTYIKLMQAFPAEIELLETVRLEDINRVGGAKAAAAVKDMRLGRLGIIPGGGGKYGRVTLQGD